MPFQHGISVTETSTVARTLAIIATGVIGLVVTGPAADAAAFPLNTRVKIAASGIVDAIAKAGATGTIRSSLQAIADQVRAPIVLVRVAPGVAAGEVSEQEATDTNVIAGLQLLLGAETQLGLKPRIIGAPGLDSEDVADELAAIARKLRAFAYAFCHGGTVAEKLSYRESFDQRELMLIAPNFLAKVGTDAVPSFAVARALGLRARIDAEQGWHKTLSNVPVEGVVGTTQDISFDFQSVDTDANQLNEAGITTIVSINGQLRFWGNRTCADPAGPDKDFVFESATRTAQVLADTIAQGMIWAIDKPLTPGLARDIVERINETFRGLGPGRANRVLGAEAWFDADMNPVADLKAGMLRIRYKYTPVPPLENLLFRQEITDEYLADFAEMVAVAA